MPETPITEWIRGASQGEQSSENDLWNFYFQRVVRLARSRMFALQAAVYDEEDAAISALNSLFRGLRQQRFPELKDRHNLWRILTLITKRKLRAQWRKQRATSRRPPTSDEKTPEIRIEDILDEEPTPDFVAAMMDEVEHLLGTLEDDTQRRIALMRMDGLTHDEIAVRLSCASRTVRRKIERIRDLWGVRDDDGSCSS